MTATTGTTTAPHAYDRLGPHTSATGFDHDCFAPRSLRARIRDRVRPLHEISGEGATVYEVAVTRPRRGRMVAAWAWAWGRTWTAHLFLLSEPDPEVPVRQDLLTVWGRSRLGAIQAARHFAVEIECRQPLVCGGVVSNTCPVTITVVDVDDFEN